MLVVFAAGIARADLKENFENYSDGAFVSQTGGAWSGDAAWKISTQNGNKVLVLESPNSDLGLIYTGEEFSSAGEGYTMMMTMSASGLYSPYSGWLCDTDSYSPVAGHGHRFYAFPATFLDYGDRWSYIENVNYSITRDTKTYFRQYRRGENVKVYMSSAPITTANPGTLILDGTVPVLSAGGNYLGLYGVGTVSFDDIEFHAGNFIPDPDGMANSVLVENFESYSDGAFVSQTGGAWSGDAAWKISTQNGNKVLVLESPNSDLGLIYTGEEFSSAGEGYTMMMTMSASGLYSPYSGWLCDTDSYSPVAGHGHRFYAFPATFLDYGDRWSYIENVNYSITRDTKTYFRQYRRGENVKVYMSSAPITTANPGTLILDGTVPALSAGGNYLGFYGVGTVSFDDIEFRAGNYIPEGVRMPIIAWYGLQPGSDSLAQYQELAFCGFTHNLYPDQYTNYQDLQVALDRAQEAGVKMFVKPFGDVNQFIAQFKDHPALEGYFLDDEPKVGEFASLATQVQTIQNLDPNHWCYINLNPTYGHTDASSYENYVNSFLSTVPVKVLSFDHYPVTNNGIRADFYENLEIISAAARKKGIPFWAFARSAAWDDDYSLLPTQPQLRYEMFSNLAYGAQGLQYFTYWSPAYPFWDAPINTMAQRTSTWYLVQSMTKEIQQLAKVFWGAKVVRVGHTGDSIPSGTTQYTPMAPILDLTTTGSDGAVVSELTNGENNYLVVVNRDIYSTMTLNVTVDTTKNVFRVSKDGSVTALSSGAVTVEPADIVVLKWSNVVVIPGDFNSDNKVNATDIDLLSAAINSHSTSYATYDLTKDGKINSADMDYLITTILHTYYGDADLNHSVGVSDLSVLAAYYNTPSGASWANGDFDGNGAVGVSDLSILAANYNSGSASTVSWAEAYAQAFGTTSDVAVDDASDEATADEEDTSSTVCSSLGLSLIAGLALMGLMIVKLEE
jgi:hypothetical protein